jgi:hypothetical protein
LFLKKIFWSSQIENWSNFLDFLQFLSLVFCIFTFVTIPSDFADPREIISGKKEK